MKRKEVKSNIGISQLLSYKHKDIYDVLGRMEVLVDKFDSNKSQKTLVPFLETYYMVTKNVTEKTIGKKFFINKQKLEELDIVFASLYFNPLKKKLVNKRNNTPWKTYFEYCSTEGIPFLQMILGISSHINGDLPKALMNSKYNQKKDFLVINDILEEVLPQIMSYLAFHEHDVFAFSSLVFSNFMENEFHKIIVKWRKNAWNNYLLLNGMNKKDKLMAQKKLLILTEQTNKKIIGLFNDLENLKNVNSFLDNINSINVRL